MKYHLIGEMGVSMRGIKKYLESQGNLVSGSDLKLKGHSSENITPDIDVVVRTSAVNPGSAGWVEVEAAQRLDIRVVKRSEIIGELTKDKRLIAISGMHGKTTITAMVGLLLVEAGFDPTVLVGDEVREFNNDVVRIGQSDWFVLEACEYDRSFLDFFPEILILTNVEEEHLDTYPAGISEIMLAFGQYLNNVSKNGAIIACSDDENVRRLVDDEDIAPKVIKYGFNSEDYNHLDFALTVPGRHNIQNALSVLALADYLGIDRNVVEKSLSKFGGAHRRLELRGNYNGADLIDDYGHHPTEISTTIAALSQKYPDKKKIVVFWPHQYKRILPLLDRFATAFTEADRVIVKPIYFVPGRDEVLPVSSEDLVFEINKHKKNAIFYATDEEIVDDLSKTLDENSVLLTIGIPPVYQISDKLLEKK
ncbi:MAG: Mur ligase family protein [Candidatus Berkelbacteria bacterium]|nr:Mur ligase family protein [Candidatus Berkelbacteria bacterium]